MIWSLSYHLLVQVPTWTPSKRSESTVGSYPQATFKRERRTIADVVGTAEQVAAELLRVLRRDVVEADDEQRGVDDFEASGVVLC